MVISDFNAAETSIDHLIIHEAPREYGPVVPQMKDAVVIDIGANIGCFTAMAVNAGAKKVYAIEPVLPNIKRLKHNARKAIAAGIVEVLHGGIVVGDGKTITLRYFEDGLSMGNTKTVDNVGRAHWRGRPYVYEESPGINFEKLLDEHTPDVLKLDCEGAEYDCILDLDFMPKKIKTFIAEFHHTSTVEGIENYFACVEKLQGWGFKADRQPNLVKKLGVNGELVGGNQFFVRPIAWRR